MAQANRNRKTDQGEAKTLKEWRLEWYLSQKEAAKLVSVNQSSWANWERGATAPSITTKGKIVAAFAKRGVASSQIIWPEKTEKTPKATKAML